MNKESAAGPDLAAMLRSLDLAREDTAPELGWLEATYAPGAASPFWNALLADAGLAEGRLRSRPGKAIELYYDAIARHEAPGAIALSVLGPSGQFQHLSYAELDARATECAADWSLAGLKPGDVVALVLELGVTWLIAFASALRLGLIVSCLGSLGEDATSLRLRALSPKRIVFDPSGPAPPAEFAELSLAVSASGKAHVPPPRAYGPEQVFAKLFSPVRAPLEVPVKLSAETALLLGLRDARFAYRLGPNTGMALPGFSLEQHLPAAILSSLLSGSRFVALAISAIERTPAVLSQPFLTTLGVSPELCRVLRQNPAGPMPALALWVRSVDEPLDWPAWQDFIQKHALKKVPVGNLLVDAASGGAVLISARRPGSVHALVVPAPGVPFVLTDVASGAITPARTGVFTPGVKPDPKQPGWFLLARRGEEYLYGSTVLPRRAGRVFPEGELVSCVTRIPGVDGACVVPVATGDPATVWAFVLLLFVGALDESACQGLARQVRLLAEQRLGSDFVPDRVDWFSLYARRVDQKLDLEWCRHQYSAGFLPKKVARPVFRRLTALRARLRTDSDDAR